MSGSGRRGGMKLGHSKLENLPYLEARSKSGFLRVPVFYLCHRSNDRKLLGLEEDRYDALKPLFTV